MAFRTNKVPVLQEKTASGSVASFNTALAMPLPSCNIAVNAWQEGSGDPSPDNVRNIVPRREVNVMRSGFNMCNAVSGNDLCYSPQAYGNYTIENGSVIITGNTLMGFIIPVKPNTQYTGSFQIETSSSVEIRIRQHDKVPTEWTDGYLSQKSGQTFSNYCKVSFITEPTAKTVVLTVYSTRANTITNWQCEFGDTMTEFKPFTAFDTYTIQFGQEVYGAEVDVVNGVAHCTHRLDDMGDINWIYITSYANPYFRGNILGLKKGSVLSADSYKYIGYVGATSAGNMNNYECASHVTLNAIYFRNDNYTTDESFKEAMTGKKILYELETPFDIQLTPTQIETLIGNNTIFADTGDTSVVFKDLDIAKRGNFREVFKLP